MGNFFLQSLSIISLINCKINEIFQVEKLNEALLSRDDLKLKEMLYGPEPPTVAYNVQVGI